MTCRHFRIQGRVQGVFFRQSTQTEAMRLGLKGYVRNLADGSVEVVACGTPEALAEFETWLYRGPPMARVEQVSRTDTAESFYTTFEVLR